MTTLPDSTTPVVPTNPTLPAARRPLWGRLLLIGASLAVYALACALPAATLVGDTNQVERGYELALLGWLAILIGQFGWFANLFWATSLVLELLRLHLAACITAALGFLIALQTLTIFGVSIPMDEGGVNHSRVQQLDAGFYIWLLSMLVIVVGALVVRARDRAQAR